MIFTTRPLKVELAKTQNPFNDLLGHTLIQRDQGAYRRKAYFVRCIGSDQLKENLMTSLQEWIKSIEASFPSLYLSELDGQMSYEASQNYSRLYEAWEKVREENAAILSQLVFPVHLKSEVLELTQKTAFTEVMKQYEQMMPQSNETMKRNFGVKLLHWIAQYLPILYGKNEMSIPKVIYGGEIKKQEFLFLYWLHLMGCDVLYIHSQQDLAESFPECQRFSTLYKGKYQFEIEWPKTLGGRGSINLAGRPRKKQEDQSVSNHTGTGLQSGINLSREEAPSGINLSRETSHRGINLARGASAVKEQNNKNNPPDHRVEIGTSQGGINLIRHENHSEAIRRELSYEALAKLSTSIVMIEVKNQAGESYASGSGVVIHEAGFILTNFHVVKGGVLFGVKFENDDQIYTTNRVIKYHSDYDLAIIKVERSCKSLPLFRGSQVVRGQKVVAIGSPLGLFNSISDGIISGFREFEFMRMIQFTAPTSHGSSGGALLNLYGELIGICTAGFDGGQNLNLAVDYETIQRFAGSYL